MHIEGTADETALASGAIFDSIKNVRRKRSLGPAAEKVNSSLDTKQLEKIVEHKGEGK